jgi:hypothetical protein
MRANGGESKQKWEKEEESFEWQAMSAFTNYPLEILIEKYTLP